MEIREAITKYLSLPNMGILDEGIFYNVLKDLNAFEQIPASQHIMKAFITKGYLKDVWNGKKDWQIKSRYYLIETLGFQASKVEYVITELEDGFKKISSKETNATTTSSKAIATTYPHIKIHKKYNEVTRITNNQKAGSVKPCSSAPNISLEKYEIVKIEPLAKRAALFFFHRKEVEPIDFENSAWIGYSKTTNILRTLEKANIISHGSTTQPHKLLITEKEQINKQLLALENMNKKNIDLLQDKIYKSTHFFIHTDNADPVKLKHVLKLSEQELKFILNILEEVEIISKGVYLHRRVLFIKDEMQAKKALATIRKEYYPNIPLP